MFKKAVKEELKVPADINYLGEMRDFVMRIGRKYGISEQVLNAFKLAIDEAGTNIIRHAYRDWDGFITMRIFIRDKDVTISMIDQGHSFDPRQVKDPDLKRYVDIGKKGGLGIFIIRRVIDQIDYRKTVEGNELRLTKERRVLPKFKVGIPGVSFSMKLRVSLISSLVFTLLVFVISGWFYFNQTRSIQSEQLEFGRSLAKALAKNVMAELASELPDNLELSRIASALQRDNVESILEALIIDNNGEIQGCHNSELLFTPFFIPKNKKNIDENILEYTLKSKIQIYDILEPVSMTLEGESILLGQIHIFMRKESILDKIFIGQKKVFSTALLVWIIGCMGILIIINMTMSPLKKLSKWVQALGHGETVEEMQFDASDELGEIANAFNEITDKFRKSQENLAEQERLQKEMQVAQEIQHTLLPGSFPDIEGYELASYYEAAKEVGGDYFDFVEVDKDTLGIVVADVSGKGVPGSLVMTMIRTALRTEARGNKNAADVLAKVNDFVMNDMKRGMFVTIFYIILDSKTRTISYASAGHNPMILYRGQSMKSYYLNPRGFPIGISLPDKALFRKSIQSDTLRLREGDVLLIYTDGITEAMNSHRERFGDERFLSTIRKFGNLSIEPMVDKLKDEIASFTGGFQQSDDITMVAIREKMNVDDVLYNLRCKLITMVKEEGVSVKDACQTVGVSTSTYYKYKKLYEKHGFEGLKEKVSRSEIEERHISIEDKAKILDIIKNNPEYGAKRISEELNKESYGFTEIDEKRIYDELKKSRLNTKKLREVFLERGQKGKRMKPPGTPFLTLDGQVIMEVKEQQAVKENLPATPSDETKPVQVSKKESVEETTQVEIEKISDNTIDEETVLDLTKDPVELEKTDMILESDESDLEKPEEIIYFNETETFEEIDSFDLDETEFETEFETILGDDSESAVADLHADVFTENLEPLAELEKTKDSSEETETSSEVMDEVFDEFLTGSFDLDTLDSEDENLSTTDLKQETNSSLMDDILFDDELTAELETPSEIDNEITSSVGDELIDQEFSDEDEDLNVEFEGLTEDIGYDQKDIFEQHTGLTNEALLEANKKQLHEAGLWFYKQGLYGKAVEEFGKAIEEDPESSESYQFLGDTLFRMGQLEKAKEAYEKVKRLDPDNLDVLENLGVIFANSGDYKKAVWQWGEVLKRNPHRTDIIRRIKRMQRVIRLRSI